jgi:hypothetical protein
MIRIDREGNRCAARSSRPRCGSTAVTGSSCSGRAPRSPIWAETISEFDDLCFLLPPRLAGVAQRAWSDPRAGGWTDHRVRLARHGRLWAQDDLAYFRSSAVDWR